MITVGWIENDNAYDVRQDGDWIGDFETLEKAGLFALAVADNSNTYVELLQPELDGGD